MTYYFAYIQQDWIEVHPQPPRWVLLETGEDSSLFGKTYIKPTRTEAMVEAIKQELGKKRLFDGKHTTYRNFVLDEYERLLKVYPEYFV